MAIDRSPTAPPALQTFWLDIAHVAHALVNELAGEAKLSLIDAAHTALHDDMPAQSFIGTTARETTDEARLGMTAIGAGTAHALAALPNLTQLDPPTTPAAHITFSRSPRAADMLTAANEIESGLAHLAGSAAPIAKAGAQVTAGPVAAGAAAFTVVNDLRRAIDAHDWATVTEIGLKGLGLALVTYVGARSLSHLRGKWQGMAEENAHLRDRVQTLMEEKSTLIEQGQKEARGLHRRLRTAQNELKEALAQYEELHYETSAEGMRDIYVDIRATAKTSGSPLDQAHARQRFHEMQARHQSEIADRYDPSISPFSSQSSQMLDIEDAANHLVFAGRSARHEWRAAEHRIRHLSLGADQRLSEMTAHLDGIRSEALRPLHGYSREDSIEILEHSIRRVTNAQRRLNALLGPREP